MHFQDLAFFSHAVPLALVHAAVGFRVSSFVTTALVTLDGGSNPSHFTIDGNGGFQFLAFMSHAENSSASLVRHCASFSVGHILVMALLSYMALNSVFKDTAYQISKFFVSI